METWVWIREQHGDIRNVALLLVFKDRMATKKEAIPFITIVDSGDKGQVSFQLNKEAVEVLNSPILKNKKLAVVAIAGPQRTGKSFLANRLLKRMDGFAIGPSTIPCTKGIWIWSEPVKVNQDTYLIIIDTEGLNSVQRDINVDIKIFSLSILLSSVFIYNSIGHIDEKALENMSLVLSLSNSICTRKGEDEAEIGKFFPYFYWVLRDFSLDLKGKSEKEYLDECLRPVNTNDKDPKNQIRGKLNKFFPLRSCECFPRPLNEEGRLAHIEQEKFENLRPAFIDKMKAFEKAFFANLPVKLINGKAINNDMFIALTYEYLNAINGGGIPEILTSLQRVILTESRKVMENLQASYLQAMAECMKEDKLPLDETTLEESHNHYLNIVNQRFDEKLKQLLDPNRAKELRMELNSMIKKEYEAKVKYNSEKSEMKCKEMLNKFFNAYRFPQIDSVDSITASLVQEKYEQFRKGIKEYMDKTKAPKKYIYFIERVPKFMFDFFDKLVEKVKKIYSQQNMKLKVTAKQAQEQADRIRATMKQQEALLYDRQKELQEVSHERDMIRKELEMARTEEAGEADKSLETSLESRKRKIATLKQEKLELADSCAKLKSELTAKKAETITLQRKLKELELKSGPRQDEELTSEVFTYMNELKQKLAEMDEYYKKRLLEVNPEQKKCREIEQIRNEKFMAIERSRQEMRLKKEEAKQRLEKMKESYDKNIDVLNKHLENVKAQNIQLKERLQNTPGNEQKLKGLMGQRKKLEQALTLKQNTINVQSNLNSQKDRQITKLESVNNDLKDKLALLNAQKANMESFKETFAFVLRESLCWVLNRQNKLKHSIKTLNKEDFDTIKQTFADLGLNPF